MYNTEFIFDRVLGALDIASGRGMHRRVLEWSLGPDNPQRKWSVYLRCRFVHSRAGQRAATLFGGQAMQHVLRRCSLSWQMSRLVSHITAIHPAATNIFPVFPVCTSPSTTELATCSVARKPDLLYVNLSDHCYSDELKQRLTRESEIANISSLFCCVVRSSAKWENI